MSRALAALASAVAVMLVGCGSAASATPPSGGSPLAPTGTAASTSPGPAAASSPAALSGQVTDGTGHPLAAIEIVWTCSKNGANQVGAAFTASDGSYSGPGLSGDCTLAFRDPDHVHAGGNLGAGGLTASSQSVRHVTLGGAPVVVDAVMPLGHTVSGRLVDDGGAPLAGFLVELVAPDGSGFPNDGEAPDYQKIPMARTALDGTFSVRGVGAGSWVIGVEDPDRLGVSYVSSTGAFASGAPAPPVSITGDLTLPVVTVPNAVAARRGGHRISGRVTDGTGAGVEDVPVGASTAANSFVAAITASDGTYILGGVQPGTYKMAFGPYLRQAAGQIDGSPVVVGTADVTGIDASPWQPAGGLWSRLPSTLAGTGLFRGEFAPSMNPDILAKLGKTAADVSETAAAFDHPALSWPAAIDVNATRVRGEDAQALRDGWLAWRQGQNLGPAWSFTVMTVNGKTVIATIPAATGQPVGYAYALGDVMFEVSGPVPDLLGPALDALP